MRHWTLSDLAGRLRAGLLIWLAVTLLPFSISTAQAQLAGYTFRVIADNRTGSQFKDFGVPTLNSRGEVVFAASLQSGGSGIYRYGGTPQTLLPVFQDSVDRLDLSLPSLRFAFPAIDESGRVLYQVDDNVFSNVPGGSASTVANSASAVPPVSSNPSVGNCTFPRLMSRTTDSSGRALISCPSTGGYYLGGGGSLQRVTDFDSPVRINYEGPAEVSSTGVIGAVGSHNHSIFGCCVPVFIRNDALGTTILVDPEVRPDIVLFPGTTQVAINNSGRLALSTY